MKVSRKPPSISGTYISSRRIVFATTVLSILDPSQEREGCHGAYQTSPAGVEVKVPLQSSFWEFKANSILIIRKIREERG